MMDAQTIVRLVSMVSAAVILAFGIIVLTGYMIPPSVPFTYRIVLGIVIIVYAMYRISFLWMKLRRAQMLEK